MEDTKIAEIRAFCDEMGLNIIRINKKTISNGVGKKPKLYHIVHFTCYCINTIPDSKSYVTLKMFPMCTDCYIKTQLPHKLQPVVETIAVNNNISNAKLFSIPNAYEQNILRVDYLCKCGNHHRKPFDDFKKNPLCLSCNRKKIAKPIITDDHIKKFAEDLGCKIIEIKRDIQTNGKRNIHVSYICPCGKRGGTVWNRFVKYHNGKCQSCQLVASKGIKESVIKDTIEQFGHEYIGFKRTYKFDEIGNVKRTNIMVLFICKCDINDRRLIECMNWEWISKGSGCNKCKKERVENTNMIKYGARYGTQTPDIRKKQKASAYKKKIYTFPSGKTIEVQGYEPFAYDILLKRGFAEEFILCEEDICNNKNIPEFWYEFGGKKHRYFPDICLLTERKIIEVKSTYTAQLEINILELKRESVLKNKFLYEMWIFDSKGNLTIN